MAVYAEDVPASATQSILESLGVRAIRGAVDCFFAPAGVFAIGVRDMPMPDRGQRYRGVKRCYAPCPAACSGRVPFWAMASPALTRTSSLA
ncbi:hypothetical protein G6F65_023140 [Rhizopus arrhizus]|nr:hypothetical protein G6F65_023140 [Rhizopus arrhizus]